MRVAVYYNNTDIRIEDRPRPSISDNELLVEMRASGICGTDVMEWYRIKKAPCILGHEMAGEIVETGASVKEFKKGDRIFVSHHVPCYKCRYCAKGNYTACEFFHAGNYYPGGFSEFVRVPAENVRHGTFLLPDGVTYMDATMIEPLACAVAGQNQLGLREGQTTLIIGSGVSGILHIQLSRMSGAKVVATDIDEYRMNKAIVFGAHRVIDARKYSLNTLKKVNDDRLADVVIVCAASKKAVQDAITSVDRKGKILFFAVPQTDIIIPSVRFWRDEISIFFSYGAAPADIRTAIGLISSGMISVRKMISHTFPLSDIAKGFKLVAEGKDSLKVVIVPNGSS